MHARQIVEKFGGQSALAQQLGKPQSTVSYWIKTGKVPAKWQPQVLALAHKQGVDLTPADFVDEIAAAPLPPAKMPVARYKGTLQIVGIEVPCYVLSTGQRVIGRTSATELLTGIRGGGDLEKYIGVSSLSSFINLDLVLERMVQFSLPEVEGLERDVKGLPADLFIDICQGFVRALEANNRKDKDKEKEHEGPKLTARQAEMAIKASMFLAACAKVGLDALIDEATGYQYERAEDALRLKLKLYLEEDMRKWESTFPEQLWLEFGKLTNWKGPLHQRPKYWGKLVMELIYGYLDPDVAKWLKANAPKPVHGQNYHQWLSSQYGLKKLTEHIWMVIGMASACKSMPELRARMAERFGRTPVQLTLYLPYEHASR